MTKSNNKPEYSTKYYDEDFEYRHVVLSKEIASTINSKKLLTESEWRDLGIVQSRGWIHYDYHK